MMIRFIAQYRECAVQLLNKDKTYQFVRERHLAERNLLIGTVIHFGRKTVRSANDKYQPFASAGHAALQPLAVLHRSALAAMLVKQHDMVTGVERGKQGTAFGALLLRLAHVAGALNVADVLDVEGHIMLQPLHIFLDALTDKSHLGLADNSQCNLHINIFLTKNWHKISKTAEIFLTLWSEITKY